MGLGEIFGIALLVAGIVLVIVGAVTATSPIGQAQNQAVSSLPPYFISALGSGLVGGILIVVGILIAAAGGWILAHSR